MILNTASISKCVKINEIMLEELNFRDNIKISSIDDKLWRIQEIQLYLANSKYMYIDNNNKLNCTKEILESKLINAIISC